jgi:hypothetical protein
MELPFFFIANLRQEFFHPYPSKTGTGSPSFFIFLPLKGAFVVEGWGPSLVTRRASLGLARRARLGSTYPLLLRSAGLLR